MTLRRHVTWGWFEALLLSIGVPLSEISCWVVAIGVAVLGSGLAHATPIYSTSLENQACNSRSSPVDGKQWNYEYDTQGHVRCSPLDAPDGGKYYAGENVTSSASAAISIPLGTTSIVSGTTYYLGGVWRFDRIGGLPIWRSLWDFDKLHEINYASATGFRWIIESGYPDSSTVYHANQFTFAAYGSDAIFPGWTYYDHNLNGYSRTAPYWCDYERWYSVVMGITAHQSAGRVRMWINGTQVMDHTGVVTMLSGATLEALAFSMTVGQPDYAAPNHNRYLDRMMLTTVFQDLVDAGYLADPQGGGTSAVLQGSAAVVATVQGTLQPNQPDALQGNVVARSTVTGTVLRLPPPNFRRVSK